MNLQPGTFNFLLIKKRERGTKNKSKNKTTTKLSSGSRSLIPDPVVLFYGCILYALYINRQEQGYFKITMLFLFQYITSPPLLPLQDSSGHLWQRFHLQWQGMHFFDYHVQCLLSNVLLLFSLCQKPHQPQILRFVAWIRKPAVLQDMIRSTCFVTKCRKVIKCLFRCFDTVFWRPYRYFSIALKVILSLFDRYKIFTSD